MASAESPQGFQLNAPITMPEASQATINASSRRVDDKAWRKRSSRKSRKSSASSSGPESPRPRTPSGPEQDGAGGKSLFRRLRSFFSKNEQEQVVNISGSQAPPASSSSYRRKEVQVNPPRGPAAPQNAAGTSLSPPRTSDGSASPRLTSQLRGTRPAAARTVAEVTPGASTQTDGRRVSPPQVRKAGGRFARSQSEGTLLSEGRKIAKYFLNDSQTGQVVAGPKCVFLFSNNLSNENCSGT